MRHPEDTAVLPPIPGPLVLVVDDELTPRSIVCRMVRTLGYGCHSCPSGRSALAWMAEHRGEARVLLADLGMPRMDGGELAERARDLEPGLLVVLMAAADDAHLDLLLSGYWDLPFIPKPVSFGALAGALEDLVGSAGASGRLPARRPAAVPGRRRTSGRHPV